MNGVHNKHPFELNTAIVPYSKTKYQNTVDLENAERWAKLYKEYTSLFLSRKWGVPNFPTFSFSIANFQIIEKIAKGGFGQVFKVLDKIDCNLYALKKISFNFNVSKEKFTKILREVQWLAKFDHIHVMRYHTAWVELETSEKINSDEDGHSSTEKIKLIANGSIVNPDPKAIIPALPHQATASKLSEPLEDSFWADDITESDENGNNNGSFNGNPTNTIPALLALNDSRHARFNPLLSTKITSISPSTSPSDSSSGPKVIEATEDENLKSDNGNNLSSKLVLEHSIPGADAVHASRPFLSFSAPVLHNVQTISTESTTPKADSTTVITPISAPVPVPRSPAIVSPRIQAHEKSNDSSNHIENDSQNSNRGNDQDVFANGWLTNGDETPDYSFDATLSNHSKNFTKSTNTKSSEHVLSKNANLKQNKLTSSALVPLRDQISKIETFQSESNTFTQQSNKNNTDKVKRKKQDPLKMALFIKTQLYSSTLAEYLEKRETIDAHRNFLIFKQIVSGLHYIHSKGCVHRDIKPANIFLAEDGTIKIGDFGLARDISDIAVESGSTTSGNSNNKIRDDSVPLRQSEDWSGSHTSGLGTAIYAAPEQMSCNEYTKKVDIFSLGIIVFELHNIFKSKHERATLINNQLKKTGRIPDRLMYLYPKQMDLVLKMTNKDPNNRPTSKELHEMCFTLDTCHTSIGKINTNTNTTPSFTDKPEQPEGKLPNTQNITFDNTVLPPENVLLTYDNLKLVQIIQQLNCQIKIQKEVLSQFLSEEELQKKLQIISQKL